MVSAKIANALSREKHEGIFARSVEMAVRRIVGSVLLSAHLCN